ncbi:MAG: hypothetical protein JKY37_26455 [Nannocystaceae bacterium]|nr:hypothetical protein [Nannocystaceae bacterium]
MVSSRAAWIIGCLLVLPACGDDDVAAASGTDGETGTAGGTANVSADGVDETADDDDGEGDADNGGDCNEDADCTSDCMAGTCEAGACTLEPALTAECRPSIDIEYPPRGATIEGEPGDIVTVVGTVTTGVGTIESLTFNGEPLDVQTDGTFTVDIAPSVGGNTMIFETVDSKDWARRRVQSFLWSSSYMLPTEPMEGVAPQGLLMHLGQESIDDGDRSLPIDDLGSVFHLTLDSLDLGSFINPATPIASQAGYDIYVTSLEKDSASVSLTAIDGGMHLDASLNGIDGDLVFDCTNLLCLAAGGDSSGGLTMTAIEISADIIIGVSSDHEMQVDLTNVSTQVNNLDIYSNNIWTNFLLSILEPLILGGIVSDVENLLSGEVTNVLGPLLVDGLAGFSISAPIDFPSLADPDSPIVVQLETDVGATDFHDGVAPPRPSPTQSGLIEFRGAGYVQTATTPHENLGIPARAGCGSPDVLIAMPRIAPLEIGLADDLLNQLLYGAWAGGLLEFDLVGGDDDGGGDGGPIQVQSVKLSGMLAPTATDCNDEGSLLAHIGDLQITATIDLNGTVTDFVAYSSMALVVEIGAGDGGISINIPSIAWMETELTVEQDASIENEAFFLSILEGMLEEQLLSGLSGGFGGISLPEIDLSAIAGLPPGSALLSITVDNVERRGGISVLNSHF